MSSKSSSKPHAMNAGLVDIKIVEIKFQVADCCSNFMESKDVAMIIPAADIKKTTVEIVLRETGLIDVK